MRLRLRQFLPVLLMFVAGQPSRGDGVVPELRVGLALHRDVVRFSGSQGLSIHGGASENAPPYHVPAGETWEARASANGVILAGPEISDPASPAGIAPGTGLPQQILRLAPAEGGTITVDGITGHWDKRTTREYRGEIEIRRDGAGGLNVINTVDIESYLRGVVPSEMPAKYPLEALRAQAVAARGQALIKGGRHEAEGFDLCATQHCQVYGGATSEDPHSDQAVASTAGEVVVYNGRLADTLYSSTCGGHTANNEDYWAQQQAVPYLRGVGDFEPEDNVGVTFPLSGEALKQYLRYAPRVNCYQSRYAKSDKIRWWLTMTRRQMQEKLAALGEFGDLLDVRVAARAESGMVRKVMVIGSRKLMPVSGGEAIRKALGLQSATFAIESYRERPEDLPVVFIIYGAGWGHQVGMCQVGAAGLAEEGWDYRRILEKYYQGCVIERRY